MASPSPVRVVSRHIVKPPPRPRERIPLTPWDVAMLSTSYIQKGLLFAQPPLPTAELVAHLQAMLADALGVYYPVAGRFVTEQHRDGDVIVGSSVSIDCGGQGVEIHHAVADGVAVADVIPPDADVPLVVQSLFPLNDAISYDGHELPLFAVQVTELVDGVFLGFACSHSLCDGTSFWNFLNAWAEISRARLASAEAPGAQTPSRPPPLFERWSPDGSAASPAVLPYADLSAALGIKSSSTLMRERMLHFSAESLAALKERAQQELVAAGDQDGAAALTRFQALSSLVWRSITRARRLEPEQETRCFASTNNRGRLRPPLPAEYFGNCIKLATTDAVRVSELLARGHGWAAAAVGRAVAAQTDASIRAHVAAWTANPMVYTTEGSFHGNVVMMGSSPRFDMYGCDFGWGKALAARSGRANKMEGKASLYPGRDGGFDVEVVLLPEHMAELEQDDELWTAVSPDVAPETEERPPI